ncbi:HNH endonuclease signature motif containing protein [Ileibacterium valens]|uniref:HNH endonuclease signature motif containing protein n=1 Tax=Ileibacterium valens TaxID=1862668 RepID=UPI0024BBD0C5|nr:HNH endonuclease [Ileibacterium valens]
MPKKPKHPCGFPGCPNLTETRFCPEHTKEMNKQYEKYYRNWSSKQKYGRHWKRIRDRYASEHPWCEECLKEGRYTPVEHVHHRVPLRQGGSHDESNLESVCKSCHSRIHAKLGDRFGK